MINSFLIISKGSTPTTISTIKDKEKMIQVEIINT